MGNKIISIVLALIFAAIPLQVFAATAAPAASAAAVSTDPDWAAVDEYLAAQMKAGGVPGLSLAVVRGDQIVYEKGYGVTGPEGDPTQPDTPFIIGSLSKSYTALAVMQLVEKGKLELDAPVQRYLPWFQVADAQASAQITVRDLLNQTSGLAEISGVRLLADGSLADGALESHVRALSKEKPTQPVGAAFQYCNGNYTTLGLLVQTVTGIPYEQYIRKNIFQPLAMNSSYTAQDEAVEHGMATGYRQWFGQPIAADVPYPRGEVPAGYIITSARDMAHFLIANLNEGRYNGQTVLSPAGMALLHQPSGVPAAGMRDTTLSGGYGMGWFVGEINGLPVLHHGGSTANFQSYMVIDPASKLGFVILTNAHTLNDLSLDFARGVFSLLSGGPAPAVKTYPMNPGLEYLVVPVLILVEFVLSVVALRRWIAAPAQRRPRGLKAVLQVGMPVLLSLFVLYLAITVVSGTPSLEMFFTFEPASAWLTAVSAGFAALWLIIRSALTLLVYHQKA